MLKVLFYFSIISLVVFATIFIVEKTKNKRIIKGKINSGILALTALIFTIATSHINIATVVLGATVITLIVLLIILTTKKKVKKQKNSLFILIGAIILLTIAVAPELEDAETKSNSDKQIASDITNKNDQSKAEQKPGTNGKQAVQNKNEQTSKEKDRDNPSSKDEQTEKNKAETEKADREKDDEIAKETIKNNDQPKSANGTLKVHYIDVGQGDATLLEVNDNGKTYTMLIDAGDFRRNDVIPYLNRVGVKNIDVVVATHPHADHIGQLADVLKTYNVGEVWMSGDLATTKTFTNALEIIDEKNIGYLEPRAGDTFNIGGMNITILHPTTIGQGLNNGSVSMRLVYGNVSFVFTGDAESKAEQQMVDRGQTLKADIMHLGHHGSDTSTTAAFFNKVNPSVAIYSAGATNSYGHPSPSVVERVIGAGVKLYGTDVNGTIIVTTDGKTYDIKPSKGKQITSLKDIPGKDTKTEEPKKNTTSNQKSSSGKGSNKSKGNGSATSKTDDTAKGKNTSTNKGTETSKNNNNSSNKGNAEQKDSNNSNCMDINEADKEDLMSLDGIGETLANRIIENRRYNSMEDLLDLKQIGPKRLETLKTKFCVK